MSYYSTDFSWLIAMGILIALPLVLSFLSEKKITIISILTYMTIINAFIVSTGLLPMWTMIMFLILIVGITVLKLKNNNNNGGM